LATRWKERHAVGTLRREYAPSLRLLAFGSLKIKAQISHSTPSRPRAGAIRSPNQYAESGSRALYKVQTLRCAMLPHLVQLSAFRGCSPASASPASAHTTTPPRAWLSLVKRGRFAQHRASQLCGQVHAGMGSQMSGCALAFGTAPPATASTLRSHHRALSKGLSNGSTLLRTLARTILESASKAFGRSPSQTYIPLFANYTSHPKPARLTARETHARRAGGGYERRAG